MARDFKTLLWDYIVFVLFILLSTLLPFWSRIYGYLKSIGGGGRTTTTQNSGGKKADFVFATGSVSLLAIMLSIARGTLGIRSVLGYPSELFYRGSSMWETIYGMVNAYPIVCFVFVPIYFNLGITSVYQYLDLRFKSRLVRCLASGVYILRQVCALGITVYTPSVALSAVLGVPYWASIVAISIICIIFTVFGGLKAAINADVIQTLSIMLVTLAVIIKGTISGGGVRKVYNINKDNGRLQFMNFTGDMTVRVDTTSAWLGQLFMSLAQIGCQQNFMQRYVSLKSLKEVKRAMMSNIPVIIVFFSLAWIAGMVIYASYFNCDPFSAGLIKKTDEILPFFVEDELAFIPGFIGLFMATLFNGALCICVSNLNSISTVIWEDFLSLLPLCKGFTDKQQLRIIKLVTVVFGFVVMGIAFGVGFFSGVIETSMIAFSATSGPLLGAFILAMLIPIANWKGTATGMILSTITILWMFFGGMFMEKGPTQFLETTTNGCLNNTFSERVVSSNYSSWLQRHIETSNLTTTTSTTAASFMPVEATKIQEPLDYFYSVSYMYYSLLGTVITVLVGYIVSICTQSADDAYDFNLIHPMIYKLYDKCFEYKPYLKKMETKGDDSTIFKISSSEFTPTYKKKEFV